MSTSVKYVEERWLPNHVIELTTREKYAYYLSAHIFPVLGPMRMADIFPEHIREWIAWMQREGRSAWTIQYCKSSILNAVFTTALNDQVTYIHPCRGVKIPTVPATPRTIVTPEQFDAIYAALPNADAQLLVETAIETGLRWGELAELRPGDLDLANRMLTVSRKVIELNREFHPDGRRFLVKRYPKDKEYRRLKLSPQITAKLKAHIQARSLGADALLFARRAPQPAPLRAVTDPRHTRASPSRTRQAASTGTARSAPTPPGNAAAPTVVVRSRTTGPGAGRRQALSFGPGAWRLKTSTSAVTGSDVWSGGRLAPAQAYRTCRASTTCGTRMPRGSSPVAPTCRS